MHSLAFDQDDAWDQDQDGALDRDGALDQDQDRAPGKGKTRADWAWLAFPNTLRCRWVPQGDGTFELQLLVSRVVPLGVE